MLVRAPALKFHFREGRHTMILPVLSSPALISCLMVVRLLLLLGLDFFAMIFPVVYIGAISISFLFVVIMFNIQIAEIHEEVLHYLPVSGIIGLMFWW
uniref:NADH-ubiquinone oxidoreductase chain 6 n=1 Tax=Solanum lycopersicum TaxID=4081 RepID=A0A3Q7IUS7_SOLLC